MMMVMRVESEGVWWWCVIVSIGGRKGGVTASSWSLVGVFSLQNEWGSGSYYCSYI